MREFAELGLARECVERASRPRLFRFEGIRLSLDASRGIDVLLVVLRNYCLEWWLPRTLAAATVAIPTQSGTPVDERDGPSGGGVDARIEFEIAGMGTGSGWRDLEKTRRSLRARCIDHIARPRRFQILWNKRGYDDSR